LKVGIKGKELIINGVLYNKIKVEDCFWTLEDRKIISIHLEKVWSHRHGDYFNPLITAKQDGMVE
jgi:hypothetical protein